MFVCVRERETKKKVGRMQKMSVHQVVTQKETPKDAPLTTDRYQKAKHAGASSPAHVIPPTSPLISVKQTFDFLTSPFFC